MTPMRVLVDRRYTTRPGTNADVSLRYAEGIARVLAPACEMPLPVTADDCAWMGATAAPAIASRTTEGRINARIVILHEEGGDKLAPAAPV